MYQVLPTLLIGGRLNLPYRIDLGSRISDMGVGASIDSMAASVFDLVPKDLLPMIDSGYIKA